jgi:hypothetical protein
MPAHSVMPGSNQSEASIALVIGFAEQAKET